MSKMSKCKRTLVDYEPRIMIAGDENRITWWNRCLGASLNNHINCEKVTDGGVAADADFTQYAQMFYHRR